MGFQEVSSLDADVTVALGKINKETGKPYPKQAEGYYLGKRTVESKRGDSQLHFLQTAKGNLGVWGTMDLNRKLSSVKPGTMVRITSNGTKPTPNGDMYVYKVEIDKDNTIEVSSDSSEETLPYGAQATADEDDAGDSGDEDNGFAAAAAAQRQQAVQDLLKRSAKSK